MDDIIAVDRSQWKIALVGIATAIACVCLGYAIHVNQMTYGLIATIVVATALLLQSLMVHSGRLIGMLAAAQGAVLVVAGFWGTGITNATLLGGLVAGVLLIVASWRGQNYAGRTLTISVREAGRAVTPLVMTVAALIATIAITSALSADGLTLSRSALEGFLKPGEWITQRFAPGFALNGTLGEFVRANSGLVFKGELAQLPKSQQDEAIAQVLVQIQETIRGTFAVNARVGDTMLDIIEKITNAQLKKIPEDLHTPVWLGVGVLIFLTIKGIAALLGGIVGLLAAALYQLFMICGFLRLGLESRQKEVVVL